MDLVDYTLVIAIQFTITAACTVAYPGSVLWGGAEERMRQKIKGLGPCSGNSRCRRELKSGVRGSLSGSNCLTTFCKP